MNVQVLSCELVQQGFKDFSVLNKSAPHVSLIFVVTPPCCGQGHLTRGGSMFRKIALISLAAIMAVGSIAVEAKRIGGGKSTGAKRDTVTQRAANPPAAANSTAATAAPGAAAVAPASAAKPAAAAAAPAAAAAAPKTGLSRFLPMLGGLALGAALASMFGGGAIGSMIANILMFAALGLVALFAFRWFMARKNGGAPALAGAAFGGTQRTSNEPQLFGGNRPAALPELVAVQPVAVEPIAAGVAPQVPAGFDVPAFEKGAKSQFIRLQAAFDKGEAATLKDMLTDEMYAEVDRELKARGANSHPTEVVTLNSEVIEVTSESDGHWASVRFHGMLREDGKDMAEGFDEVWNMFKPIDNSAGWMLAGIQQLG
jgi:predicted lipid-binding transport protein (Tim44 family)